VGMLLFKEVSKLQLVLSFLMAFIGFSQAFNNWGEKRMLSLFFLIASMFVLIVASLALIFYRKRQIIKE
jgi:NADH:ubiquinone oxidoreductase subunit K